MIDMMLISKIDRISGKVIHKTVLVGAISYLAFSKKITPTSIMVGRT
jgi:hypothetical protein